MLRAVVPKFCTIGGNLAPIDLEIVIQVGATGALDRTVQSFTTPSVICNTAADVIATSRLGRATRTGKSPAPIGFTDRADYIATAQFGGVAARIDTTLTAAGRGGMATTPGAVKGNLIVTITPVQPAVPLVPATVYTDTLRVTLLPR